MKRIAIFLQLIILSSLFFFNTNSAQAQDFLLQGWYWEYPKTCDGNNWSDTLDNKVVDLSNAGFTHVWLPPLSRASFGNCSNGYDPKDLYDLGEYGGGATGFATRTQLDALISTMNANGMDAVADVVYNHRDGGDPETNPDVKSYIENFTVGSCPFPSDRFRVVLPLGGASGNNAGDYYFKISSKTGDIGFQNKPYNVLMETSLVNNLMLPDDVESEPNGGGDCGQPFDDITMGVNMQAITDGTGCFTDEFKLTLSTSDFNAAGDELIIFLTNDNNDYSDHRIYGIWNASAAQDVAGQLIYETYTDFTNLPSGQGAMNYQNFKPNSVNSTNLCGDWDGMWFFYDYDQYIPNTNTKLIDWTKWLWDDVNIRGFRMDAVKHFDPVFLGDLLDEMHDVGYDPELVVGEVFDGNPVVLQNWVSGVYDEMDVDTKAAIDVRVFDFAMRNSLKDACDLFGYDVRNVFNSGLVDGVAEPSSNVVTFVNNHDFRGPGEPVQNDPMLAYAYILTNNQIGLPTVFYSDYFGTAVPNYPTVDLEDEISQLMKIHQDYIFNSNSIDHLSRFGTPYNQTFISGLETTTLAYQLSGGIGGREIIVAINFAGVPLDLNQGINMNNLIQGDTLIDLTGNALTNYTIIDSNNEIKMELPPRSYAVWVQGKCLEELSIDTNPVTDGTYLVSDRILSTGTIANGSIVEFLGGNYVKLNPGFETELGADFLGDIESCTFSVFLDGDDESQ